MSVLTAEKPHKQQTRLRRMAWPVIGAGITVGAAFYIRAVDPNNGGYPFCPLKYVTGIDCPACGGLRCVHALMSGDIGTAMDQNLLAVFVLPMIAVWAIFALRSKWRGGDQAQMIVGNANDGGAQATDAAATRAAVQRLFFISMIAITIVFTIARNIPGVPFLPSGVG